MNRILDMITPRFITENVYLVFDLDTLTDVLTEHDYEQLKEKSFVDVIGFTHKGVYRCFNLFGVGLFARITNIEAL